ncbi:MAG: glycoside hydrolase family 97 catalytic domain-containing protein [Bacteroidales bacterium]|nr:glycoside hydrolase family 97 catalytic domain-containing protein [Bacteroidales bacterium]
MKKHILTIITGLAILTVLTSCNQIEKTWQLESPNQSISIEILQQELGSSTGLFYSVDRKIDGSYEKIMDLSPLGIECKKSSFVENLEFISAEQSLNQEDQYILATGKKLSNVSEFNSLELTLQNQEKEKIVVIFRAYDQGIAFQYLFPGQSENKLKVVDEITGFDFMDGNFWGHPYDTLSVYTPAFETYYEGPVEVGTSAPWNKNGWAFPILVESNGTWMLVSEAGFDGTYGASHLHAECDDGKYRIKFAEAGEAEGFYENSSLSSLPMHTPWRFIAIGESLHEIVETTLPTDLSAPSKIDDISWIQPGRATWSWWSDNDSPQDYERMVPFVDFASEMGWEYFLVDANWNRMKNGTMEQLAVYAEGKNVGLLLWYNSGGKHNVVTEEPRNLMDDPEARRAEFERISKLGIKGVKVDFFQSDKQDIIKQYIDILKDAADFKLLVNFHGCTMPKGWRRTWPNLVSMEAVRGEECYIFDGRFPELAPRNMAILPFTRNAVGPVDYTPGGYSDNFYPHLTTFGFELALPVILESGIMHHADTPGKTLGLPPYAVEFLKEIPVVWEDTRYLDGYPGKEVVIARKSGNRWYIAGINGENLAKEITIDLSPLGEIPASIDLIVDGEGARDLQSTQVQPGEGKLSIQLKPYGGFAGYWE